MTTEATTTTTHVVTYAVMRRPAGLNNLHRFNCACGRAGNWTDRDTSREQGQQHGRSV